MRRNWLAAGGLVLLAARGASAHQSLPEERRAIGEALRQQGVEPADLSPDVIVSWNRLGHDLAFAEDQFLTFKGQRALAMMHLAVHDALNAIVPVYETYSYRGKASAAQPIAAAAQAAHDVLAALYPTQAVMLGQALAAWLAKVPPGPLRDRGVALGHAVAAAIIVRRQDDGWDVQGTYEFRDGPGEYQTTPPWDGFVAQPGFRLAKPFALEYPGQFRPPPP